VSNTEFAVMPELPGWFGIQVSGSVAYFVVNFGLAGVG
jgi:hypothetical protein